MDLNSLLKISYGLYIISSKKDEKLNGMIATTASQVTAAPPRIIVTISKENLSHEMIMESRKFGVSVLRKDTELTFVGRFGFKSGRISDKFEGLNYKMGVTGVPIVLDNAISYYEAEVVDTIDVGTHTIFVGDVKDAQKLSDEEPMTYDYYHKIKGGKSQKNAPTYLAQEKKDV